MHRLLPLYFLIKKGKIFTQGLAAQTDHADSRLGDLDFESVQLLSSAAAINLYSVEADSRGKKKNPGHN